MWKNVVIGILLVFSLFFFFYGLTQQIKAEQAMNLYKRSESESLKLKEELHVAQLEIERQAELFKSKVEQAQ
jgi:hypothetical protein